LLTLNKISIDGVEKDKLVEVKVKRQDAMRGRLRAIATDGEDVVIDLPRGEVVNDGDVFGKSGLDSYYKIVIETEPVMKVSLDNPNSSMSLENAIKLGYNLGNRHLEVLIEDNTVYVPVTIGEEKIKKILEKMKLPIRYETVQKVISTRAAGYHAGEDEH
jgi:urease accessory protein UreE